MSWFYSNVTLTSQEGDLSVVVYLPYGIKPDEPTFYLSSRFDHGSMIGSITRKIRSIGSDGRERVETHELFGTDMWRIPHNSNWPESGVGLASEFGVGDDGAFCYYRCGWSQVNDITNGVLGYREARIGEPFLKIGVGELVKGTCPTCDSTEDFKFNSPYLFSKLPKWTLAYPGDNVIRLEHSATLRNHGYMIVKEIALLDTVLTVTTTLTNLGNEKFSTAWYSHNLFTCDGEAVGPGYQVYLNLKGNRDRIYDEPGTWSWSKPLRDYAIVSQSISSIGVRMVQALYPGIRIKTEFVDDGATHGGFRIEACKTSIDSSIPELEKPSGISMYAYNLYVERATFSPEPQILISLEPGQSTTWTQRLVISDLPESRSTRWYGLDFITSFGAFGEGAGRESFAGLGLLVCACLLMLTLRRVWGSYSRRRHYDALPESTSS